jgi:hypothetical protein
MRSWRIVVVAVLAGLLAACATSGAGSAPRKTGGFESKVEQAPDWDDDQLVDYISELAEDQLMQACGEMRTMRTQIACARTAIYQGFDTTGQAKVECDDIRAIEEFVRCVVLGSMMHDVLSRAAPEKLAEFDWQSSEAKLEDTGEELGHALAEKCLEGDLADIDGCFLDRIAQMFSLTPAQSDLCADFARTDDAADCMLRVFFIDHFETALRRMGQGSGRSA